MYVGSASCLLGGCRVALVATTADGCLLFDLTTPGALHLEGCVVTDDSFELAMILLLLALAPLPLLTRRCSCLNAAKSLRACLYDDDSMLHVSCTIQYT
jgi:hypothetical protein